MVLSRALAGVVQQKHDMSMVDAETGLTIPIILFKYYTNAVKATTMTTEQMFKHHCNFSLTNSFEIQLRANNNAVHCNRST